MLRTKKSVAALLIGCAVFALTACEEEEDCWTVDIPGLYVSVSDPTGEDVTYAASITVEFRLQNEVAWVPCSDQPELGSSGPIDHWVCGYGRAGVYEIRATLGELQGITEVTQSPKQPGECYVSKQEVRVELE